MQDLMKYFLLVYTIVCLLKSIEDGNEWTLIETYYVWFVGKNGITLNITGNTNLWLEYSSFRFELFLKMLNRNKVVMKTDFKFLSTQIWICQKRFSDCVFL